MSENEVIITLPCTNCAGAGIGGDENLICPRCDGDGRTRHCLTDFTAEGRAQIAALKVRENEEIE